MAGQRETRNGLTFRDVGSNQMRLDEIKKGAGFIARETGPKKNKNKGLTWKMETFNFESGKTQAPVVHDPQMGKMINVDYPNSNNWVPESEALPILRKRVESYVNAGKEEG